MIFHDKNNYVTVESLKSIHSELKRLSDRILKLEIDAVYTAKAESVRNLSEQLREVAEASGLRYEQTKPGRWVKEQVNEECPHHLSISGQVVGKIHFGRCGTCGQMVKPKK